MLGLRGIISFEGSTAIKLRARFKAVISDFLQHRAEWRFTPEKPASAKIMLRVPPENHAAATVAAQASGKSLNQWATEVLRDSANAYGRRAR